MAENFKDLFILEPNQSAVRLCSSCNKDINLDIKRLNDAGWKVSHGLCERHIEQMYKMAGFNDQQIKASVKKAESAPDFKGHARDLSDSKNKPLVDWLKNPPVSPTLQKQQTKSA